MRIVIVALLAVQFGQRPPLAPFDVAQGSPERSRGTRDVVLLNAGAALFVGGHASTVQDGIAKAAAAIDSGAAMKVLDQLIAVSNRAGAQA